MSDQPLLHSILETQQEQGRVIGEIHGTLEALCKELLDNGQPGRMTKAEKRLTELEMHRHKTTGWVAGASAVTSLFISVIVWILVKAHLLSIK